MKARRDSQQSVSVSELGAFASSCEQQALLRYRDKVNVRHETPQSRAGDLIHTKVARQARHYEAERRQTQDSRCYVATALYGPSAYETQLLRDWRDDVLRQSVTGRLLIAVYYRVSPHLVSMIAPGSNVERAARVIVNTVVRCVEGYRGG